MERIEPPVIPPRTHQPDVVYTCPLGGLGRDVLVDAYLKVVELPVGMDRRAFKDEARGWTGALGRRPWMSTRVGAACLLLASPRLRESDPRVLDDVITVLWDLTDPLSIYSTGWRTSLDVLRPRRQGNGMSDVYREAARYALRRVRDDMTGAEPTVLETEASIAAFLADQRPWHTRNQQAALNAYATKIGEKLRALGRRLPKREAEALFDLYQALIEEYEAVPDPVYSDTVLAGFEVEAEIAVMAVMDRMKSEVFTGDDAGDDELFDQVRARLAITCVNRLRVGRPLDDIHKSVRRRVNDVKVDRVRRQAREEAAARKRGPARKRPPETVLETLFRLSADFVDADPTLRLPDGALCWEAVTAKEFFAKPSTEEGFDIDSLTSLVEGRWEQESPAHSRSGSGDAAAQDVRLLMMTTLGKAQRRLQREADERGGSADEGTES